MCPGYNFLCPYCSAKSTIRELFYFRRIGKIENYCPFDHQLWIKLESGSGYINSHNINSVLKYSKHKYGINLFEGVVLFGEIRGKPDYLVTTANVSNFD